MTQRRLRVCLVGHTEGSIDEGMKKVATELARELSKRHDVTVFNPTRVTRPQEWGRVRKFRPDIIHYVPGPSAGSFPLARTLSLLGGGAPVVMSAIHPKDLGPAWLRNAFKPRLLLVQSTRVRDIFAPMRVPMRLLPLGVDAAKFAPVPPERRSELRKKHGIPEGAEVILHVGNIREGRNIRKLCSLVKPGREVIVVGSTSVEQEHELLETLKTAGVRVWTHYLPEIEEIYQLADVYVFPVRSATNAIEFPLSVLEAMATQLPVITTRFGGLPLFLREGGGLFWLEDDEQLPELIERALATAASTRDPAIEFTWSRIVEALEEFYVSAIEGRTPREIYGVV